MKYFAYISFIVFFTLFSSSCQKDDDTTVTGDFTDELSDPEIATIIEEHVSAFPEHTQVSIAIIDNEKTEYIGIIKENDAFQLTDNKNKVFEIGSISKVFTSVLLANLIYKKEAFLDETLQDQFDFALHGGGEVQLLQLANHTSGIPRLHPDFENTPGFDWNDPYISYTPELLETYLAQGLVLKNPAGSTYEYSNLGMGLLGYVLTKKTGKTYENLIQESIFKPLQMDATTTELSKVDPLQLIEGIDDQGNTVSNWNFTDVYVGAGGIKSSVSDMEKFTRKNFENDEVFNLPQSITYPVNADSGIGLGWGITEDEGYTVLFHDGGTGGYTSTLALDKDHKKAVIVLSNISSFHPNSIQIIELCFSLLSKISGV